VADERVVQAGDAGGTKGMQGRHVWLGLWVGVGRRRGVVRAREGGGDEGCSGWLEGERDGSGVRGEKKGGRGATGYRGGLVESGGTEMRKEPIMGRKQGR